MSGWILSHVPSGLLLFGLIAIIAGGAILLVAVVRRRFPALTGDQHNDATKFIKGFITLVYAFFIGFVVSSMWGETNDTDTNARAEGAAAVELARDTDVFDKADADRIRQSLLGYERAAIAEWDSGRTDRSTDADAALAQLSAAYHQVTVTTDSQRMLL